MSRSTATTSCPAVTSFRQVALPMKPAAPVRTIRTPIVLSSRAVAAARWPKLKHLRNLRVARSPPWSHKWWTKSSGGRPGGRWHTEGTACATILVTGACSGIGRASCLLLAEQGHTVLAAARNQEALAGTAPVRGHTFTVHHQWLSPVVDPTARRAPSRPRRMPSVSRAARTIVSLPGWRPAVPSGSPPSNALGGSSTARSTPPGGTCTTSGR
ncbi:MAG: SDR family NAD(P)-dependent oxidoreductase [Phycicoccus sp.]